MLLILPTQLFDKKYIKDKNIILYEHPQYFTKYKFNKKKILLHRASMKYYYDYLKENNYNVKYINFYDELKIRDYIVFNPIDKIKLPGKYKIIDTPNLLLTENMIKEYRKKTDKFVFNNFYMWSKKKLNIIPNIKSQDKYNRKKLPKNINVPKLLNLKLNNHIENAKSYVKKHFNNNYGNLDNFIYPITHKDVKKWLKDFIKNKLNNFGTYQDYIDKNNNYLFHSILSSSINIGLINPIEIIKEILKTKVKKNNLEGFIRQLFWREYQRYCYKFYNFNDDYFNNKNKITKKWYNGTTEIPIINDCIIKGFNSGYLHHIERLMVIGNYMNLCQIKPKDGFKWFMEFSCDSYEWVMKQNVLDMVFFISGGKTMRRPYISSSNYLLNMSNYKKGEWVEIWNNKYEKFIIKNNKKLYKFRYFFPSKYFK